MELRVRPLDISGVHQPSSCTDTGDLVDRLFLL
jgi:hypothetical protein